MRYGGGNRSRLLLIILIVSSLFLITLDLRGVQVLDGLRTGSQTVLSPFQKAGNTVASPFKNFFSDITHLGRTRNQLEQLRAENFNLRTKLINRKNADALLKKYKTMLDLAGTGDYKILSAKVISQGSSQSFSQSLTIDAGSNSGIRRNMTVICDAGLVGVVKEVYPNSALILLASDPSFRIGVRIAGTQQIGILSGQGSRKAVVQLIDNQTTLAAGDVLLARGSQLNRPFVPGVPVGTVTAVDNSAGAVAQSASVKFYTNFSALGVVAVVVGAPKTDPRDALVPAKPRPTPIPTITILVTPSPSPSATK